MSQRVRLGLGDLEAEVHRRCATVAQACRNGMVVREATGAPHKLGRGVPEMVEVRIGNDRSVCAMHGVIEPDGESGYLKRLGPLP